MMPKSPDLSFTCDDLKLHAGSPQYHNIGMQVLCFILHVHIVLRCSNPLPHVPSCRALNMPFNAGYQNLMARFPQHIGAGLIHVGWDIGSLRQSLLADQPCIILPLFIANLLSHSILFGAGTWECQANAVTDFTFRLQKNNILATTCSMQQFTHSLIHGSFLRLCKIILFWAFPLGCPPRPTVLRVSRLHQTASVI